jgi:peptidoglycan/LPS O-acetylase OafA/YrhL
MKRFGNIDALRGFCALLVVVQHLSPPSWLLGGSLWQSHPHFYLDPGRIGVTAFFLISGYVIPFSVSHGDKPVTKFWISRCFRLWPAYWLSIVLACLVGAAVTPPTWKTVVVNATMLQRFIGIPDVLGVFWTLQIELIFYFIITVMIMARVVGRRDYFRKMFYLMVAASLALSAARGFSHIKLPVALPMGMTLMFLAGYIRHCRLASQTFPRLEICLYLFTLAPVCLMGYGAGVTVQDDPYRWMLAYGVGLALFLLFETREGAPRFCIFLGSISYSIYLLHESVIKLVQTMLGDTRHLSVGCLSIVGVVIISWLNYRMVERPFQQIGRNLIHRHVVPSVPQPIVERVANLSPAGEINAH